jgi:prephenate dehydrogenase
MWSELFLENKENLLYELDYFKNSLQAYRDDIAINSESVLSALLEEGKQRKEQVDG